MENIAINSAKVSPSRRIKYGITESKKESLDNLTTKVLDAQFVVDQDQAVVTSLTDKWNNFSALLAAAEAKRTLTLNNKNQVDLLVQSALDLKNNSQVALNELAQADIKTKELAPVIKEVMNKLIYSAEVINKLASTIIRKKALNPLISDELISQVGVAGTDANTAVALTLVALQAAFAAQASNIESEAAMALEFKQATSLYTCLTSVNYNPKDVNLQQYQQIVPTDNNISLRSLLHDAYAKAVVNYNQTLKAFNIITKQLSNANSVLSTSQVKLQSLQSGLAAANAAALAS
jgi:hypothetical protein